MGSPEIQKYPMIVPETFSDRKGTCHFELKGEMYIIGGYEPEETRDWQRNILRNLSPGEVIFD